MIGQWLQGAKRPVIVVDASGSMSLRRRAIARFLQDLHPFLGVLSRPAKIAFVDHGEPQVVDYRWDFPVPGLNGGSPELENVGDLLNSLEADRVIFVTDGDIRLFGGESNPLQEREILWAIVSAEPIYLERMPRRGRVVQIESET